jgi:hypothetical protein
LRRRKGFINKFELNANCNVFIAAAIPKINAIICVYLFVQFTTFTRRGSSDSGKYLNHSGASCRVFEAALGNAKL